MAMYDLTYLEISPTTPASKKDWERPWDEVHTAYRGTKLTTRQRVIKLQQFATVLMQQVSTHERKLPAEVSILGQNQGCHHVFYMMTISKGGDISAKTTRRNNQYFLAYGGIMYFSDDATRSRDCIIYSFHKKCQTVCCNLYLFNYLIFNPNSARVKPARHKVIAATQS